MLKLKNICFFLTLFVISLASCRIVLAKDTQYYPAADNYLKTLFPSANRYVEDLSGEWERSLDDAKWTPVRLPMADEYREKIYYRKTVSIKTDDFEHYIYHLQFFGVEDEVEFYINNHFVGRYFSSSTPISVRIPNNVIQKDNNQFKLICFAAQSASRLVKQRSLYSKKISTGVVRELYLIGTPSIWVSDLKFSTKFSSNYSSASIHSSIKVSSANLDKLFSNKANDSVAQKLSVGTAFVIEQFLRNKATGEIVAQSNSATHVLESERITPIEIVLNVQQPMLWTPTTPNLYELSTKISKNGIEIEDYRTTIGLCEIQTRGNLICLNGNTLTINGVCYVEDFPTNSSMSATEKMENDINSIKTIGANLIRYKFAPPHPYLMNLCNQMGLLVFVETPIYGAPSDILRSDEIVVRMKNLAELITNFYCGYSCLAALGIGEGIEETEENSKDYFDKVISVFKTANVLVYKNSYLNSKKIITNNIDLIGLTDYQGRSNFEEIDNDLKRLTALAGGKPVFLSLGFPIQPNNYDGYSDSRSLEFQAYYIQKVYELFAGAQGACNFIYAYNDYQLASPLLMANNKDQYLFSWGITSNQGAARKGMQTLKALYKNEAAPLVGAGSYSDEAPVSFIAVSIIIFLVLMFMMNRYRRFREYMIRSITRPYNFYADIRDQRIMSTVHSAILGMALALTLGIFLSSMLFYFRTSPYAQYILMLIIPTKSLQEMAFKSIWMPEVTTFLVAAVIFAKIFIIAFLLKIASLFVRARIFFSDTFTITIWSATPAILLLPIAGALIRILFLLPGLFWVFLLIFVFALVWIFLRLLKSTAVVFDIPPVFSYSVGAALIIICASVYFTINQLQSSIFAYIDYFLKVMMV